MVNELDLAPNETVILEENGYVLTEIPDSDGISIYTVYDDMGNYIDEFEDESLNGEKINSPKGSYIYEMFKDVIEDWDRYADWHSWDNLDDADYKWLKASSSYEPKQKLSKEGEKALVDSLCKSDTIVFHQQDPTTTMLDPIYEGRGWDVYKESMWGGSLSRESIHELIKRHDKVLCLGHGTPGGLLSGVIGSEEAELLKEKKVFALWCYAATYFKKHGFQGHGVLCSDNAPSEVWECRAACDAEVSADWIYNNMLYWSECLKDVIDLCWDNPEEACRIAREKYHKAIDDCKTEDERKVVEFNTNTLQVV